MVPIPTPIYHITYINNLASILTAGGLYAKSYHQQANISYIDIAYQNIQDRRATTPVPLGVCGNLHDYVPLYFAPRSPMLYAIHQGKVASYPHGQQSVIHLVAKVQDIQQIDCKFVFTDGHGTMRITRFFDNLQDLNQIDWKVMKSKFWNNTPEDMDRSRRRQTEFLVHQSLPWNLVTQIGVINSEMQLQVEQIIQGSTHRPTVFICRDWYYT